MDVRAPIDDIKRITLDDPTFALAFRSVIDKKISCGRATGIRKEKGAREARQGQEMKTYRPKSGPFSERPHFEPSEIDQDLRR